MLHITIAIIAGFANFRKAVIVRCTIRKWRWLVKWAGAGIKDGMWIRTRFRLKARLGHLPLAVRRRPPLRAADLGPIMLGTTAPRLADGLNRLCRPLDPLLDGPLVDANQSA
jgi:hypothetical protein